MNKTLILFGHYYPDINAGGPIKSLSNLTKCLEDDSKFYTISSCYSFGTDDLLEGVEYEIWNNIDGVNVYFTDINKLSLPKLLRHSIDGQYDNIYINSIFSWKFSIVFLIWRKLGFFKETKIIIAPRGSFSSGAMKIGFFKKKVYLFIANLFGLYNHVTWHATSNQELERIRANIKDVHDYVVVQNLTSQPSINLSIEKSSSPFKIIFLSRIHEKKNLLGALKILKCVNSEVRFDIYGPIEDENYWRECQKVIKILPTNIKVSYCGVVKNEEVYSTFSKYNLFLFPTYGENFGHVIYESLVSGCPVLTSTETPWLDLQDNNVGFSLPLSNKSKYVDIIEEMSTYDDKRLNEMYISCINYAKLKTKNNESIYLYKKLFGIDEN